MTLLTVIDSQVFSALKRDLGEDFTHEMVETFCDDSNQQLEHLRNALEMGNAANFIRAAHTLKSTSLIFGALAFGELARELEMLGRADNLEAAQEKYQQLRDACAPLHKQLKDMCHA